MTKHYFDLDYNVNPNGKIIAIDKDQKIIQIGWGADGHLLIDPNSHAGCAELSMTNKQLRQAAQRAGYDDFCIAHQEAYNGECTLCADVARNRPPAPDVVCINHEAPAGERCPNCRDVPDTNVGEITMNALRTIVNIGGIENNPAGAIASKALDDCKKFAPQPTESPVHGEVPADIMEWAKEEFETTRQEKGNWSAWACYAQGIEAMYRHNQAGLAAAKARISLLEKELIDARIQLNNLKK